jgi:hypothetical protein
MKGGVSRLVSTIAIAIILLMGIHAVLQDRLISNKLQPGSRAEPPEGAPYTGFSEIGVCHGHESHSVSTWNVGI